ncbi:MAG TPA: phosphatase [Actinomycetota bacterium]|nr:phosphatase [Actinomycetota bacterium]
MASKPHAEPEHWIPGEYDRETLRRALLEGGAAGVNSHDRPNVVWKIKRLVQGDPDARFGLTGVGDLPFAEVLRLVAEAAGIDPDPDVLHGHVVVDPDRVLDAFEAIGDRLSLAARRGERVLLATGHPTGLPVLYQETGKLVSDRGAKVIRPLEGFTWEDASGRRRQIRYFAGVAMLTDRASALHTHNAEPMERMLAEMTPDLVFADHGFAGAAIEAGVDTVSIADVNDPALVVARAQGRAGPVAVMDDNVQPETYWPCFQVLASRFGPP